jgi:hypothetical protein
MKLIDDLKAYFGRKDQEILDLEGVIEVQKNRLTELSAEVDKQDQWYNDLAERNESDMIDYDKSKADVIYYKAKFEEEYKYRMMLIETGHTVNPKTKMCELSEKFRVILFDVVRMYVELEAANDSQRKN